MFRFILSGQNLADSARHFSVQWSIMIIEPGRLPLPVLHEATALGIHCDLSEADCQAVRSQLPWACRPLQFAVGELAARFQGWESQLRKKRKQARKALLAPVLSNAHRTKCTAWWP